MSQSGAVPVKGEELEALRVRLESRRLDERDFELLAKLIATVLRLVTILGQKKTSIARLRKMLFGAKTEKSGKIAGGAKPGGEPGERPRQRAKGHGRRSVRAYGGAKHVEVLHATLKAGDCCPECGKGSLYRLKEPSRLLWLEAQPPIQATVYECEVMRCSGCGKLFTAEAPQEARQNKYDETVGSMVALFRYGNGLPFHRLHQLQSSLGVPLPPSVQWELVKQKAQSVKPIYRALTQLAAQGGVMRVDDTPMTILERDGGGEGHQDRFPEERQQTQGAERKATRTTAIVSELEAHRVVLYTTGGRQAGENMDRLLGQRTTDRPAPIQMCDGLAANLPKQFQVVLANCLAHARRRFYELAEPFPQEVQLVLYCFECIYANEEQARKAGLDPQHRLEFHRLRSAFVMEGLFDWMQTQLDKKLVEPNSQLGEAIGYMLKRRQPLTLFLRVAGAPLDNNLTERILKRAILHRKNSLFYKTCTGAEVGDMLMSVISTCRMNNVNPFHYLTDAERHAAEVAQRVERWLPWNYAIQAAPAAQPP